MGKNIIGDLISAALNALGKSTPQVTPQVAPQVAPEPVANKVAIKVPEPVVTSNKIAINWADPKARINSRFSVGEALTLQSWGVMHVPSEDEQKAIVSIADDVSRAAEVLEQIIGRKVSISVHAFMRPEKAVIPGSKWDGQDYNRYIYETQVWKDLSPEEKAKKKVPKSPHRTGHAIDFHIVGYEGAEKCLQIRTMLEPHLEALGLRMEKMNGGWVHLDNLPVVNARYFIP